MKILFLVLVGLLSLGALLVPLSAAAEAPCIAREYPQLDDTGNTLWVKLWCDGSYSWEVVRAAGAPAPAPQAPAVDTGTVGTKARVVAPPPSP